MTGREKTGGYIGHREQAVLNRWEERMDAGSRKRAASPLLHVFE